ncbi:MAG TPA: hypothetical protein VK681_04285 [Reyranella sp.]|nr:hypothetical protein [Reyranella sp.]
MIWGSKGLDEIEQVRDEGLATYARIPRSDSTRRYRGLSRARRRGTVTEKEDRHADL